MKLTEIEVAIAFSKGKFSAVYPYINERAQWNIVGDRNLQGKVNITEYCEQTAKYFSGNSTDFQMNNLISDENCVAIDGTALFTGSDNLKTYVSSCDIYQFEGGELVQINSYCITTNKE